MYRSHREPSSSYPEGYADNVFWLGGWYLQSPTMKQAWARCGISNPFKDIVNNPKAYLVTQEIGSEDIILRYIQEQYYANAQLVLTEELSGYRIFQVVL